MCCRNTNTWEFSLSVSRDKDNTTWQTVTVAYVSWIKKKVLTMVASPTWGPVCYFLVSMFAKLSTMNMCSIKKRNVCACVCVYWCICVCWHVSLCVCVGGSDRKDQVQIKITNDLSAFPKQASLSCLEIITEKVEWLHPQSSRGHPSEPDSCTGICILERNPVPHLGLERWFII